VGRDLNIAERVIYYLRFDAPLSVQIASAAGLLVLIIGVVLGARAASRILRGIGEVGESIESLAAPETLLPEYQQIYFMFVLDASERMGERFGDSPSRWEAAREAVLNSLAILPTRANYGLITLGGSGAVSPQTCDGPDAMRMPPGTDQRDRLGAQIAAMQPEGIGSLTRAVRLAVDGLIEAQPPGLVRRLFIISGGGDPCAAEEWASILEMVDLSLRDIDVRAQIIVLADEAVDEQVAARLQEDLIRLGALNVTAVSVESAQEMEIVIGEAFYEAREAARAYYPTPLAVEATAAVQWTAAAIQALPAEQQPAIPPGLPTRPPPDIVQQIVAPAPTGAPAETPTPAATCTGAPTPVTLWPTITRTPTGTPTLTGTPYAWPTTPGGEPCNCTGPDLDCGDFSYQWQAQTCFDYCRSLGYGDIFRLDSDNNGIACQSLP
jgi:hypothetical protein